MRVNFILSIIVAGGVSGQFTQVIGKSRELLKYTMGTLERFELDGKNPPIRDRVTVDWPASNDRRYFGWLAGTQTCSTLYVTHKDEMKSISKSKAYPERGTVVPQRANTGDKPLGITTKMEKKKFSKTTQGWKVGSELSGTVGKEDVAGLGLKISAEYSTQTESGAEETESVEESYECPVNHVCAIETWTWHVELSGKCGGGENRATIACENTKPLCEGDTMKLLPEEESIKAGACTPCRFCVKEQDCSVRLPVKQGKQFHTTRLMVAADFTKNKKREENGTMAINLEEMPWEDLTVILPKEAPGNGTMG
ncbi:hypothetical protein HIM_12454 [Hirsutella minnesotensis 3608]|uniref:Uncharacterized protein n=1 Tax=Hirsutella minnesotensis 3608 TaxID=1043627 RepID=A0A0F7ZEX6_9HYPO|nr:hypothetical protein HIM_12454 [Hirsutella minnesotensis 3608]